MPAPSVELRPIAGEYVIAKLPAGESVKRCERRTGDGTQPLVSTLATESARTHAADDPGQSGGELPSDQPPVEGVQWLAT
jgi:hypothetical protein